MAEFSGHLSLQAVARADRRTVLAHQSFRAPYHLSKPYWDADAGVLIVQIVNPTAGMLAGDRLESTITVAAGANLLVTTPSASRVFKMHSGHAECRQHFAIAAGAWLEFMPEPLVPHRGSSYHQITTVAVARGGGLFFVDPWLSGRVGHGEAWLWDRLQLELTLHVADQLTLRERFDQSGLEAQALATWSGSGPNPCFANAILIPPNGNEHPPSPPWREALADLHRDGLWLGTSALRGGGWSLKLIAPSSLLLRQGLRDTRRILGNYFPQLTADPRKL
ncbi:MAG: hypothetical protein RL077_6042 [Verrucomicrobiota bacterium]|jgi:urease accessory protein